MKLQNSAVYKNNFFLYSTKNCQISWHRIEYVLPQIRCIVLLFPHLFRHWINKDDCDKSAKEYRSHFKGLEHQNYYGLDSNETPIVVSVKLDTNTGCYDLIVRTNDGNQIACVKESPASGT